MTLKKLLRNVALLLLPIVLYYGVFLAFEPNNYFGLRKTTPSGAVFGAMRAYQRQPQRAVILGNSRLAHFDMQLVADTAGRPCSNLAFGGASLKESLDQLEWVLDNYPNTDQVVFGLSFYTLNKNYLSDRFADIEKALYNPFAYLTNLSYNLDVLDRLRIFLSGGILDGGEHETENPAEYVYAPYTSTTTGETVMLRTRIIEYMDYIAPYTRNWQPDEEQFARLLAMIQRCTQNGVQFVAVLPPMDDVVLRYEVEETGILAQMEPLLERLNASGALVLDYEIQNRPPLREDQFFDGFHLDYERGLPDWTVMLFTDIKNGGISHAA